MAHMALVHLSLLNICMRTVCKNDLVSFHLVRISTFDSNSHFDAVWDDRQLCFKEEIIL